MLQDFSSTNLQVGCQMNCAKPQVTINNTKHEKLVNSKWVGQFFNEYRYLQDHEIERGIAND